jgi:hypothetical protein
MITTDSIRSLIIGLSGLGVGTIVGSAMFMATFAVTFGICADTSTAEKIFPFALIADPSLFDRPLIAFILAAMQLPLYGLILGFAWPRGRSRKPRFVAVLSMLLVSHLTAGVVASHRVDRMWQQRFSKPIAADNHPFPNTPLIGLERQNKRF